MRYRVSIDRLGRTRTVTSWPAMIKSRSKYCPSKPVAPVSRIDFFGSNAADTDGTSILEAVNFAKGRNPPRWEVPPEIAGTNNARQSLSVYDPPLAAIFELLKLKEMIEIHDKGENCDNWAL